MTQFIRFSQKLLTLAAIGLFTALLIGCGNAQVSDVVLNRCLMNPNSDYAQSETIECLHRLPTGSQEFQATYSTGDVQFSLDSRTLYTLSTLIQTWDVATGEETNVCQLEDCHTPADGSGEQIFFHQTDGFVGFSGHERIYTGFTTKEPEFINSDIPPYTDEAYIEGQDVFASYNDSLIYFYNRNTAELVAEQTIEQGITLVVGGRSSYATAIADHRIVIWPIADEMSGLVLEGHETNVVQMIYSDDESLFLSADQSGLLIVWELASGSEVQRLQLDLGDNVSQVLLPTIDLALSPDNALLVTRADRRTIRFWSMSTGEVIAELSIIKFGVADLDISPDGTKLAVGLGWAGVYDQNARSAATDSQTNDPDLLEPGEALLFDISELRP